MRARYAAARVHRRRRRPSSTWQLVKQSGADQKQRDLVRVHENTRKNLEQASMRSREISRDLEQEILAQILTYREGRRSA